MLNFKNPKLWQTVLRTNQKATPALRHMSYTHNFYQPPVFYCNGMKYVNDYVIDEYEPVIQAFIQRRWTTKREVYPKFSMVEDMEDYHDSMYL